MIKVNGKEIKKDYFPDGTLLLKESLTQDKNEDVMITWNYDDNEEMLVLYFLTKHFQAAGYQNIILDMPYIPNARQDRVKVSEDVFTLKYFAEFINQLHYKEVRVLDAHSNVSLALIDRVQLIQPVKYIEHVIEEIERENGKKPLMFYPDEGAGKRYSGMISLPYCFGIKKRNWSDGKILGLSVTGEVDLIKGNDVLIVDDICSYGGTFYHSARMLKELGARNIYLFISHCEKNILKGELFNSDLVKQIYTTNSIFDDHNNEKIKIVEA